MSDTPNTSAAKPWDLLHTQLQETGVLSLAGLTLADAQQISGDLGIEPSELLFTLDGKLKTRGLGRE